MRTPSRTLSDNAAAVSRIVQAGRPVHGDNRERLGAVVDGNPLPASVIRDRSPPFVDVGALRGIPAEHTKGRVAEGIADDGRETIEARQSIVAEQPIGEGVATGSSRPDREREADRDREQDQFIEEEHEARIEAVGLQAVREPGGPEDRSDASGCQSGIQGHSPKDAPVDHRDAGERQEEERHQRHRHDKECHRHRQAREYETRGAPRSSRGEPCQGDGEHGLVHQSGGRHEGAQEPGQPDRRDQGACKRRCRRDRGCADERQSDRHVQQGDPGTRLGRFEVDAGGQGSQPERDSPDEGPPGARAHPTAPGVVLVLPCHDAHRWLGPCRRQERPVRSASRATHDGSHPETGRATIRATDIDPRGPASPPPATATRP